MQADILCSLIAKQINPEYFQLWGLEVHWMKEEYNTSENRAIVQAIIDDYENLSNEYLAEQEAIKADDETKKRLAEIDLASIRSIREYIAGKTDAPKYIKDYDAAAAVERNKLIGG